MLGQLRSSLKKTNHTCSRVLEATKNSMAHSAPTLPFAGLLEARKRWPPFELVLDRDPGLPWGLWRSLRDVSND